MEQQQQQAPAAGGANGARQQDPSAQNAAPSAEEQAKQKRVEQVKAVKERRFWARTRSFVIRYRAAIAIAAVVFIVAYGAIVRAAWTTGAKATQPRIQTARTPPAPIGQGSNTNGGGSGDASGANGAAGSAGAPKVCRVRQTAPG